MTSITVPAGKKIPLDQAQVLFTSALPLSAGRDELRLIKTTTPYKGITIQRYEQWLQGIKVEHGGYTVTARDNRITTATGIFYDTREINTAVQPVLSEEEALGKALQGIGARKYAWETTLQNPRRGVGDRFGKKAEGTLVWIENLNAGLNNGQLLLAYKLTVPTTEPLDIHIVYIDALDGNILFRISQAHHLQGSGASLYSGQVPLETASHPGGFALTDASRGGGIVTLNMNNGYDLSLATEFTATSNTDWNGAAADVHWGTMKIYDYWKTQHNRKSYNDLDSPLISMVHCREDTSQPWSNAAWIGNGMIYGDGIGQAFGGSDPFVAIDICAHEIGHGVCQETADLIYMWEPGALNEGFSDIWGAVIEAWADPLESDAKAKNRWLIGEEIRAVPIRNLKNPKLKSKPDTYLGEYWRSSSIADCPNPDITNDNCWVHYNSSVLAYWFYLLTEGGTGTNDHFKAYNVAGIGMDKAAKIVYLTELSLSSNANYEDCRIASVAAAGTLFGDCSAEYKSVVKAWYAVGIGDDDTCGGSTAVTDKQGMQEGIRVVSNPFKNQIVFRYNLDHTETVYLYLFDASGRLIYQTSPKLPLGIGSYTLDLSNTSISNGWYMLQMVTSGQIFKQKLIKE